MPVWGQVLLIVAIVGCYAAGILVALYLISMSLDTTGKAARKIANERQRKLDEWNTMQEGDTKSKVRAVLGPPSKVEPLVTAGGGRATLWTYGHWPYGGSVTFDHNDRVIAIKRPSV